MKKEIKKLSLNKKTISNLTGAEMNGLVGGGSKRCSYSGCSGPGASKNCTDNCTQNQNTCPGHNTCYAC